MSRPRPESKAILSHVSGSFALIDNERHVAQGLRKNQKNEAFFLAVLLFTEIRIYATSCFSTRTHG